MPDTDPKPTTSRQVAYLSGSATSPARHSPIAKARRAAAEERIALEDSAVHVVTDFTWEQPLTIGEDRRIAEALREMILRGVHALLVVHGPVITGLITSYDIQGEPASRFPRRPRYTRREEIEVAQIMTPWDRVPTLDWQRVCTTHVSDIVRFFHSAGATHAVIVEYADQGEMFVRGVISRSRLERQLGYSIGHPERRARR
jgi:CBS domain-containing protein